MLMPVGSGYSSFSYQVMILLPCFHVLVIGTNEREEETRERTGWLARTKCTKRGWIARWDQEASGQPACISYNILVLML